MLTEKEIRNMAKSHEEFEELVVDYFDKRYGADEAWKKNFHYDPSINSIEVDGDTVTVIAEADGCSCGCSGTDTEWFEFPLSHLWEDQTKILNDMKKMAEQKAEQKRICEEKQREMEKQRRIVDEKAKLAELLKKYPDKK